jgi:hypothetical protein
MLVYMYSKAALLGTPVCRLYLQAASKLKRKALAAMLPNAIFADSGIDGGHRCGSDCPSSGPKGLGLELWLGLGSSGRGGLYTVVTVLSERRGMVTLAHVSASATATHTYTYTQTRLCITIRRRRSASRRASLVTYLEQRLEMRSRSIHPRHRWCLSQPLAWEPQA